MPGMNKQQAQKWLQEFHGQYLILGFKPDGYKGIPATFEISTITANGPEDVFNSIKEFTEFKVFDLIESEYKEDWWKARAADQVNTMTEMEERELLQKLKAKYESQ